MRLRQFSALPVACRLSSVVRLLSLIFAFASFFAAAFLLPRLLLFFENSLTLVAWPWQFDYDEGINLHATLLLSQGSNIYRPNGPEAFVSAPYPPLFYLLNLPSAWIAGPSFAMGRAISFLSTLAIAMLIGYIVWRLTRLVGAGVLSGALWLSLSPVIVWSPLYKQDMPALALGLAGLAWALTYPKGKRLLGAVALFTLAFYTKQSAISAAAATTLWLLMRDFKVGLRFGLLMSVAALVPFAGAVLLTGGGYWEHLVTNHSLPWSQRRFVRQWGRLTGEYWPLILLAGSGMLAAAAALTAKVGGETARMREQLASPWLLAILYGVIGSVSSLAQMGYEGANYNHLLDGLLPICILAGGLWSLGSRTGQGATRAMPGPASAVALGAALLLVGLQVAHFASPRQWYRGGWPSPEKATEMQKLSDLIASTPGDIYSEDAFLLLKNNRRVLYDDPSTFVPLAQRGAWEDSVLNRSIRERRFPLIFLQHRSGRWTAEWRQALEENYTLKFRGGIDIYEGKAYTIKPQLVITCSLRGEGDRLQLEGYSLAPGVSYTGINRGGVLRAALYWQVQQPLSQDYASYLHLVNDRGEKIAGTDNPLTGATQPTSKWEVGSTIVDVVAVHIPAEAAPGRYRLLTGMYRPRGETLRALKPSCEGGGELYGEAVSLGWVEVK